MLPPAALCAANFVRADQLVQAGMIGEGRERSPSGRAVDLEPASETRTTPAASSSSIRRGRNIGGAVRGERLGIEALEVGEAPRLVLVVGSGSAR